ncbi:glycosyl hydrolase family 28-related protein [Paenibacillus ehimensis]|uniref:Glycosyl hydrolase family 28-related protein n=1 Tax=Paenibacillus ehimensis TaxID=79264 RepID=A0ABT8V4Q9_9BACL|nr:glycosyl hydrolase family 28-related protein [Paenibacillus ehimensis]MDO3675738.1 glycosyl hydrolase family 28-related protein [Paenibacillus ehimensis]MEC0213062.1 glycosyl hydrolase family 28-related protein [Paenibacillus ehimensis]
MKTTRELSRRKFMKFLGAFGVGMLAGGTAGKLGSTYAEAADSTTAGAPVSPWVNVKEFGALGDGKTDDTLAIQTALAKTPNKSVFFPAGTYLISSTINVPVYSSLIGEGNGSKIKCLTPVPMLVLSSSNQFGNRYGVIRDLSLDGAWKATAGIVLNNVVVGRSFYDVQIFNVNGTALQMDATQNCNFQSIHIENAVIGMALYNGAGNNMFSRIEIEKINKYGVLMDVNPSLPGYNNNGFANNPTNNSFQKAVIERGKAVHGIYIKYGNKNTFRDCDIVLGVDAGESIVKIEKDGNLNYFERCNFPGGLKGNPAVIQKGHKNYFKQCCFESYQKGAQVMQLSGRTIVEHPHFGDPSYQIVSVEGDPKYNMVLYNAD